MKRQLKCIHNRATYPDFGVICDLRKPNSLCKNCKTYKSKYPNIFIKILNKFKK